MIPAGDRHGPAIAWLRRTSLALAAGCLALAAWAAPGRAAVTGGAPLDLPANVGEGCESLVLPSLRPVIGIPPSCTFWGGFDGSRGWTSQTPTGQWVITQARVRTGPRVGPMVFTVIRALRSRAGDRPSGIICCSVPVESQVFVPAPSSVTTVPVRLPVVNTTEVVDGEQIEVVDYLGISLLSTESDVPASIAVPGGPGASATLSFLAPALRAGQDRVGDSGLSGVTLLVNADYEPDLDGNGQPDAGAGPGGGPSATPALSIGRVTTNARNGTARMQVAVPGAGTVTVGGNGVRRARTRAGGPGQVAMRVRPTASTRRTLRRRGRATVRAIVAFKPAGGGAVQRQAKRITLRTRR